MSAQVTEAHRTLVRSISWAGITSELVEKKAQLIADSEARADAGQNAVIAEGLNRAATVSAERDQLRAEVEKAKGYIALQVARAERAEAELAKGITHVNKLCKDNDALTAELAKERARLDWLFRYGCVTVEPCTREAIDDLMQEGAK